MSYYKKQTYEEFYKKADGVTGIGEHYDMLYSMHLTGPQGARFTLFKERSHTKEDLDRAKRYLKATQDVVRIYVVEEKKK